ncbi:MAG: sigma-70 family RNA polymerase sigma factor [Lachnospiraceae bacterium]|nr:sigma-70 family RNA polymerase sigma factor [Lachnospiraceae bacterium]
MDSIEELYQKHAKTVYGFLLTKTKDPGTAEELTQETFYQAMKKLDSFQENSSVSTWLCGIAKNLWFDILRKQKKQTELSSRLSEQKDKASAPSAEELFFQNLSHLDFLKKLHNLKEPGREVIYLRLIGNLSFAQIGEIMEKSENWARVTYYRNKEKLMQEVQL